jgi:hypothetical protein
MVMLHPRKVSPMVTTNTGVVAVFSRHADAEAAIKELQHAGYDMTKLSLIGRGTHLKEQVVGYYSIGDRMKHWGTVGAVWGGAWGLFFGSAFFLIPGFGPILVAGPLVAWIVGALEGAVVFGGLSAIGAGLVSQGIPKDSVLKYELALKTDKYVMIAHGTGADVLTAREIFHRLHSDTVAVHDLTAAAAQSSQGST